MPPTCLALIQAAYARNSWNDVDAIASDPELIGVINRLVKGVYDLAAERNPLYFAASSAPVAPSGSRWAVPESARTVVEARTVAGARVWIVEFTDRESQNAPRVYRLGRYFYSVGEAGDPDAAADSLVFYYSIRHPNLDVTLPADDAANTLDASWVGDYDDLLVVPLARYLAVKDNRGPVELQALDAELKEWQARFVAELEGFDAGMTRGR